MKVLFVIHAITGGGAERVMATLINNLCQRNYDISLLTNLDIPFAYEIDNRVKLMNINRHCPEDTNGFRRQLWGYHVIRQAANESQCNVVVSFLVDMNCTVILSLLGTGIPVICSEHSNISRAYSYKTIIKRNILYRFANVVTVLTHHDYRLWRNSFSNCVRMPNPCNLIENTSINDRDKIVLAVGRVNQWDIKGFDNLIRAWGNVCHRHKDWHLKIAGAYDDRSISKLNKIIEESNAINIEFLGFRKDIGELMNKSAVFCLSSRVEGLPMALIEAMDRGCCCVAFDCITGPNEIIKDQKSGLLVQDGNVDDLSKKLNFIISNETKRLTLAKNAPFSVKKYATEKVVGRWEILFKKICKNKS